jgi:hypothetical protein
MNDGKFLELLASSEERCRQQVHNPLRERRARQERELMSLDGERPARSHRNVVAAWLGGVLIRTGEWLAAAPRTGIGVSHQG